MIEFFSAKHSFKNCWEPTNFVFYRCLKRDDFRKMPKKCKSLFCLKVWQTENTYTRHKRLILSITIFLIERFVVKVIWKVFSKKCSEYRTRLPFSIGMFWSATMFQSQFLRKFWEYQPESLWIQFSKIFRKNHLHHCFMHFLALQFKRVPKQLTKPAIIFFTSLFKTQNRLIKSW